MNADQMRNLTAVAEALVLTATFVSDFPGKTTMGVRYMWFRLHADWTLVKLYRAVELARKTKH